jgi:hypothetical protein
MGNYRRQLFLTRHNLVFLQMSLVMSELPEVNNLCVESVSGTCLAGWWHHYKDSSCGYMGWSLAVETVKSFPRAEVCVGFHIKCPLLFCNLRAWRNFELAVVYFNVQKSHSDLHISYLRHQNTFKPGNKLCCTRTCSIISLIFSRKHLQVDYQHTLC